MDGCFHGLKNNWINELMGGRIQSRKEEDRKREDLRV